MEDKDTKEVGELKSGKPMTEEELAEFEAAFQLIEDSIEGLEEDGDDL